MARKLGHMVLIVLLLNLPLITFFISDVFVGAKQKTFFLVDLLLILNLAYFIN